MNRQRQRLAVVLGMHRSGTSVITCALQVMGIDLGSNLMPPKAGENDFGFFEDLDLNQLNISMLQALDRDWHTIAPLEAEFPELLRKKGYFQEAVSVLGEKMHQSSIFAFKDPRTTALLPFWTQVFDYCHADVSYVAAVRNPISVARSLAHRNGFDLEKSIALWVSHNLTILEAVASGTRSVVVDYDRFVEEPIEEINRIAHRLALSIDQEQLARFLSDFHQAQLRHRTQRVDDVLLNDFTSREAGDLWRVLQSTSRAEIDWEGVHELVAKVRADFHERAPLLMWIDKLYASGEQIQRRVCSVRNELEGRDTLVSSLNSTVAEKSTHIVDLTHALLERDREIANLSSRNSQLQTTVLSMNQAIGALNEKIAEFHQASLQTERSVASLTHELADRDRQSQEGANIVIERDNRILSMTDSIDTLNRDVEQLRQSGVRLQEKIMSLMHDLADRDRVIQEATAVANERSGKSTQQQQIADARARELEGEIQRLNQRLADAGDRASELRNLILDRDAKLRSLAERTIHDMIVDTAARQGLPAWRAIMEIDGLAFIRKAYELLLGREPDTAGEQYYVARLRAGLPKLLILGELQNSTEGQRVRANMPGLRGAVARQRMASIPLLGDIFAYIFRVEKMTRVQARVRAVQQQVLGISSVIRSSLIPAAQYSESLAPKDGDIVRARAVDSPKYADGRGNAIRSTTLEELRREKNSAAAGVKPLVLQIEYKTTASPASVGQNSDSRELALGIRSLEITNEATEDILCKIDFTQKGNSGDFILFGFGEPESWGTWSVGSRSAIVVWHNQPKFGALGVTIEAMPFAGASPIAECVLTSSIGHYQRLSVIDGKQQHAVELDSNSTHKAAMLFHEPDEVEYTNNVSLSGANPLVSIIILNFNKPQISILSARAVLASAIGVPYEIILVDNGSTTELYAALQLHEIPVRILRIPVNRYFGEGNNLGAEAARGEYLVFLNNDAFPAARCIDSLIEAFLHNPSCGAAGPIFRYPDGRLQEAGAFIAADGKALQRGKFDRDLDVSSLPEYDVVDYVSAACLMIRTSLFFAVGGFNYRYDPAYYEDSDLCLRVKLRGMSTLLVTNATCVHIENATTGDKKNKNDSGGSTVGHNRQVFLSIWGDYLSDRSEPNLPIDLIPTSYVHAKAAAIEITQATYSPYPLVPGGGERYILAATLALNKFGKAALVTPDPYSRLRLDNVMFDLGLPVGRVGTHSAAMMKGCNLERAITMGNELFPHHLLPAKRSVFHCQFPFPENPSAASDIQNRIGNLAKCEKVIVNSEFTKLAYEEALDRYGRMVTVAVVNPPVATERLVRIKRDDKPFILSVGRFSQAGHDKRQDVLIEAMKTTSTAFRNDWTLVLCGNVPNNPGDRAYFKRLQESVGSTINVKFVLSPSTSTVDELRSQSSIYAHACGYGVQSPAEYWKCEHFGITLVEALVAGCSIICYEVGGGPEIIKTVGSGKTFGSIEELACRLEEDASDRINEEVRMRAARWFGDGAFAERIIRTLA